MTVDVAAIMRLPIGSVHSAAGHGAHLWALGLKTSMIFLFVGRLPHVDQQKGIARLAHPLSTSNARPTQLIIVGDRQMRAAVELCATTVKSLIILGRLEGERLLAAYCSADALVLPSRFEPWGLVVNEGMAAGLPIIVLNRVGCASDLVDGHETGIVYDYAGTDGLFDAMAAMTRNSDLRRIMSTTARS